MVMKIENYEGAANTYTFQHNPNLFNSSLRKYIKESGVSPAFNYMTLSKNFKSNQLITITGHFDGATKDTNFRSLAAQMNEPKIKKLFFSATKFYICVPQSIEKTFAGGRTNFTDYTGSFISPFGILFGNAQKSGGTGSAEENEGDVFTPLEKITGTVTNGLAVTIEDGDGNGFTFTPTTSGTFTLYLIKMEDLGDDIFFTEYWYGVIGSTEQILRTSNNDKSPIIGLDAGQSLSNLFSGGTVSNISSVTFYFRDGWSSE